MNSSSRLARNPRPRSLPLASALVLALVLLPLFGAPFGAAPLAAHEPDYSTDFDRDRCTFTTFSNNPWFPLWPGYALLLEGEEEDEGELIEIAALITVLPDVEMVDGIRTRVVEEREWEDDELVEVSRNFYAECRETGSVWYFGEDVDDYEDGVIVGHEGAWRAGVDGAVPGIMMPGTPINGARFFQEIAPGIAEDRGEIVDREDEVTVPAGTFQNVLRTVDTSALDPEEEGEKLYAPGVGIIVDESIELVEITPPACQPDDHTLCLADGRFQVTVEWETDDMREGLGSASQLTADSGNFYFFNPDNTELLVKVIDACDLPAFNSFWVFAAGLTNVEVTLTVTDTLTREEQEYENPLGRRFQPIQDTAAFLTCP